MTTARALDRRRNRRKPLTAAFGHRRGSPSRRAVLGGRPNDCTSCDKSASVWRDGLHEGRRLARPICPESASKSGIRIGSWYY
jgi:hypothetical protein